jgi:hypothetical protein
MYIFCPAGTHHTAHCTPASYVDCPFIVLFLQAAGALARKKNSVKTHHAC